jgi:hypothetical protein
VLLTKHITCLVVCILLGISPASDCDLPTFRNPLSVPSSKELIIVNNRWPVIILAVKCTANVPGRIKLLIVSMITINGNSIVGVPCGTGCSNMWLVFLIHLNNTTLIHKGIAKVSILSTQYSTPSL